MRGYLNNQKRQENATNTFNYWESIISGVSQSSILGPLLLSIFLNDLFAFVTNSCLKM